MKRLIAFTITIYADYSFPAIFYIILWLVGIIIYRIHTFLIKRSFC